MNNICIKQLNLSPKVCICKRQISVTLYWNVSITFRFQINWTVSAPQTFFSLDTRFYKIHLCNKAKSVQRLSLHISSTKQTWIDQILFTSCPVDGASVFRLHCSVGMYRHEDTSCESTWTPAAVCISITWVVGFSQRITTVVRHCPLQPHPSYYTLRFITVKTVSFCKKLLYISVWCTRPSTLVKYWYGEMSFVWCPPIFNHFLFVCGGMTST